MEYNQLKKILEQKKIELKEISSELNMTPNGFRESIRNETLQLKNLKKLCDFLQINPLLFFDNRDFGIIDINQEKKDNHELNQLKKENELLKSQIEDKNQIIELLKLNKK